APAAAGTAATAPASARVTAELAAALGGGTLVAFLAGLLALRAQPGAPAPGELLVAVGLAGAGGAVLVTWLAGLLGAGTLLAGGLALAAGAGLGAGYGALVDELSAGAGALLASAGALAAAVMGILIARAGSAPATAVAPAPAVAPATAVTPDGPRPASASGTRERRVGPPRPSGGLLTAGGPRLGPLGTQPVATALLAAVGPLTVAAPLVYLVGRHLPV
ncbi:hypothetical protein I6A94_40605, partial [Frankia sp. CN4]|nr:hypothetical protein [Frankia nepalensis]